MARFTDEEVQQVLENLQTRFPHATEADALTILEDGERDARAEAAYFAADAAEREAEVDAAAVQYTADGDLTTRRWAK